MASLVDGKSERRSGLLQPLLQPPGPDVALVCFPYAGGNAVNFRSMADALRDSGLAVYAVELPGHDLGPKAAEDESFASMDQVVAQVAAEITGLGLSRVMLWGHSSGAAFALAAAAKLAETGVEVARVFLGAQLPGPGGPGGACSHSLIEGTLTCRTHPWRL
jgi:surfactin synthase thioesterase subunit